jgi:hypothetical protein
MTNLMLPIMFEEAGGIDCAGLTGKARFRRFDNPRDQLARSIFRADIVR